MRSKKYKILLVDDELDILEFLGYNLRKEGFQVFVANNGKEAIKQAQIHNPHLILLDIMMPGMDGIETCREIKKLELINKPVIIFLSARDEEYLQSATESAKADDYLTKPIKPHLLISRIKEIINKKNKNNINNNFIEIEDLHINKVSNIVTKGNKKYLLTKTQFEILYFLASSPNTIIKKQEIVEEVCGKDMNYNQLFIEEFIRKIINKTGIENIKTVNGDGYIFETEE
jgi:two-component system alkaline phosphatase synthesis response regulator PhoP